MEEPIPNVLVIGAGAPARHIGEALRHCGVRVDFVQELKSLLNDGAPCPVGTHIAAGSDLVLFAVDPDDTLESAMLLQRLLPKATPVVALQPGIRRLAWAAHAAPQLRWIRCVMAFDPAQLAQPQGATRRRRKLCLSDTPQTRLWRPRFECAGFEVELCTDMQSVQWGHLLLQLSALLVLASGLEYKQMLATRAWRLRYARLLDEALGLLAGTAIEPRNLLGVPWRTVPMMLRLNDALFSWLAARHLAGRGEGLPDLSCADEKSLELAVDATCGEIMRLAVGLGADAPRTVDLAEQLMVIARQQTEDRRLVTTEW